MSGCKPIWIVLVLLASSAALAERPSALATGLLAVSEASLLADALQTFDIKHHGVDGPARTWEERAFNASHHSAYEVNPVLGSHPSDAAIVTYFAGVGLATAASWYFLPKRFRILVPLLVLALEVPQIERNARAGMVMHF